MLAEVEEAFVASFRGAVFVCLMCDGLTRFVVCQKHNVRLAKTSEAIAKTSWRDFAIFGYSH